MRFATAFLSLLLFVSVAQAEDLSPASPGRVIHDFYRWYVGALLQNRDPLNQDRARLKHYASARLIREIDHLRKGPDGLDGDYFVDAQDFDKEWAKNINVSKSSINRDHATAVVELKGQEMGARRLHVALVRENGAWKVDKVEGQH